MLVFSGLKANWNIAHAGGSFLTGVTRGGRIRRSACQTRTIRCRTTTMRRN